MVKIQKISISGIRGIKEPLTLELRNSSILIGGENGSGKSSLTDAIEWYYSDRVGHLISEENVSTKGRGALRNLFIGDEEAFVNIEYSDNNLNAKKIIDSSLKTTLSNRKPGFKDYIDSSQSENLILRHRDLVEFIISSKTDKLKKLQDIIGFSIVSGVRELLKKSEGRVSRTIRSSNFDNQKSIQQANVLKYLGQNAYTDEQFFAGANLLVEPLKIGKKIETDEDVKNTLKTIETKEEATLSEQISFYSELEEKLREISGNVDNIHSEYTSFHSTYTSLQDKPENIRKLRLLSLLKEGKNVLENDVVQDNYCPLCQSEKEIILLVQELNARIKALEQLEKENEKLKRQKEELKDILHLNNSLIEGLLGKKLLQEKQQVSFLKEVQQIRDNIKAFTVELGKDLIAGAKIRAIMEIRIDRDNILRIADEAKNISKELMAEKSSNLKFQIYTKLFHAAAAYKQYLNIEKQQAILTRQQETFNVLYVNFIKRQEEALNHFLKMFSSDINEYYVALNPNEKIEDIKLVPIRGKEDDMIGLTIGYSFFDMTKTPPTAYLSESHINCLGLAFFLASVNAFNKNNKFFVLDDVISSFDRHHRARFVEMLINRFRDYQILLFTHERGFFELMASEVKGRNWLIQNLIWSREKGVEVESSTIDIKEKILDKFRRKDIDGLGNDIRIYTEKVMKQIACKIGAPVAFRYNIDNEKRMPSELLDAVQSRISKKGQDLKNKANIQRLKGMPLFISNVSSHDDEFSAGLEDLAVTWESIEETVLIFYCKQCNGFISVEYLDNVENKIRCKCGGLAHDWQK